MNLQHERIAALCESLNLPFVAQGYGAATQKAAKQEMAYSDFLEGAAEGRSRRAQRAEAKYYDAARRVPGGEDAGGVQL